MESRLSLLSYCGMQEMLDDSFEQAALEPDAQAVARSMHQLLQNMQS